MLPETATDVAIVFGDNGRIYKCSQADAGVSEDQLVGTVLVTISKSLVADAKFSDKVREYLAKDVAARFKDILASCPSDRLIQ